jgi:hypothetical protein
MGYPRKIAVGSRPISRSRPPMPGDGSSSSYRWKRRVTVPPVQRPSPGGLSAAEPGDRELRPFAASALAPGRPVPDDRPVPRAGVAFHLDPVAGMPATRCWHERRTRAMPGPGSPGIWSVLQPAADVAA